MQQTLERNLLLDGQQSALVRAAKEVAYFVERTPGYSDESPVLNRGGATVALRNIRPNAVGGADQLMSDCALREGLPGAHDIPDQVRQLFRHSINPQIFEYEFAHALKTRISGQSFT